VVLPGLGCRGAEVGRDQKARKSPGSARAPHLRRRIEEPRGFYLMQTSWLKWGLAQAGHGDGKDAGLSSGSVPILVQVDQESKNGGLIVGLTATAPLREARNLGARQLARARSKEDTWSREQSGRMLGLPPGSKWAAASLSALVRSLSGEGPEDQGF